MLTAGFGRHRLHSVVALLLAATFATNGGPQAEESASDSETAGYPRTVTVQVIDADTREPLAEATVEVNADDEEWLLATNESGLCEVELTAPPERWVAFSATHTGYVRDWISGEPEKVLRSDRTHVIRLKRGELIGGIIVDESGAPVEGVRVTFAGRIRRIHIETMTDESGRWELTVPQGETKPAWQLQHPDFALSTAFSWIDITDEMRAGQHRHIIERGVLVRGTVVDESGTPVEGAFVIRGFVDFDTYEALREHIDSGEVGNVVVSRADGTFSIPIEDDAKKLVVCAKSFAPVIVEVARDGSQQRVVLDKGSTWAGRVTDAAGNGVEKATIHCYQWQLGRDRLMMRPYKTTTDAEGAFEMPFLPTSGLLDTYVNKKAFFGLDFAPAEVKDLPSKLTIYPSAPLQGRVYDAETRAPIKTFTVDYGWSEIEHPVATYDCHDPMVKFSKDGTFSIDTGLSLDEHPGALSVHAWARDYYPTVIDPVWALDLAKGPVEIPLERGQAVRGTLRTPDGEVVKGATVALVHADQYAAIQGCTLAMDYVRAPDNHTLSRSSGGFTLAPSREPGYILALHESGWAVRPASEHKAGGDLPLSAWCTVEGQLETEGRPEGEEIAVNVALPIQKQWGDKQPIRFVCCTTADDSGHFRIEHVPAVPIKVTEMRRWLMSHAVDVEPQPGETVQVKLGDPDGGAVHGRILADDLVDPEGVSQEPWHAYRRFLIAARPTDSEASDEYANYVPLLHEDGRFHLSHLPPGDYELTATAHENPPENACGRGTPRARATLAFSIAEGVSESLDLGEVRLERILTIGAHDAAPVIEATALEGDATWRLPDELAKGKPVLLVFWATWCTPCKAEIPLLKEIGETYGNGDRLHVIGLNLDWDKERAMRFVESEELPWPQFNVGPWQEDNPVTNAYGLASIPSNWLIGPDGKILAARIPSDKLQETLKELIPKP